MRIAVMGAGGIGGYFGARLAQAGEAVALVARGEHLRAIRAQGLHVKSIGGDLAVRVPATDEPRSVPELIGLVDVVLFCVKSYDTLTAAEAIRPALSSHTAIVSLQNGVSNEDVLASLLGRERVLGGLVYGFAVIEAPGVIRHTQGGRIVLGELDGQERTRTRQFAEVGQKA